MVLMVLHGQLIYNGGAARRDFFFLMYNIDSIWNFVGDVYAFQDSSLKSVGFLFKDVGGLE